MTKDVSLSARKPTIKDVATQAGVSFKTVSRVLNAEAGVRPDVRDRVRAAVSALGYTPNLAARGLSGGRSRLIGLVTYATAEAFLENYAYLMTLETGLIERCQALGCSLAVEIVRADAEPEAEIRALTSGLTKDAFILSPPLVDNMRIIAALEATGAPVVRIAPTLELDRCVHVGMDDEAAAADMTRHLLALGHRRIALISGHPGHGAAESRRQGYIRAMRTAGLVIDPGLIRQGWFTEVSGFEATMALLDMDNPPTAVFASNDMMAVGARSAARLRSDEPAAACLSIAGFDGLRTVLAGWPTLTTVRQPLTEMAWAALDAADALVEGRETASTLLPYSLLAGASVSTPQAVPIG